MSERQTKAGNQECFAKLGNLETWKLGNLQNLQIDPCDMLNNFCFCTRHRAGSQLKMAKVDPRDMLNNFCFHVYAQKSLKWQCFFYINGFFLTKLYVKC